MFTVEPHIQGLIFDCDGTLVDTMLLHYQAWQEYVVGKDMDFPYELFIDLAGAPSDKIIEILNKKFGYSLDLQETAEAKEQLFLEKYLGQAQAIEPVVAIAKSQKGKLPMAVGTGGIPAVVDSALKAIDMDGFFDAIVTAHDVENGKPAPDTFLEAARRMNVEPEFCVVFEDSDMGLEAARRAGMIAIDVRPWLMESL